MWWRCKSVIKQRQTEKHMRREEVTCWLSTLELVSHFIDPPTLSPALHFDHHLLSQKRPTKTAMERQNTHKTKFVTIEKQNRWELVSAAVGQHFKEDCYFRNSSGYFSIFGSRVQKILEKISEKGLNEEEKTNALKYRMNNRKNNK